MPCAAAKEIEAGQHRLDLPTAHVVFVTQLLAGEGKPGAKAYQADFIHHPSFTVLGKCFG